MNVLVLMCDQMRYDAIGCHGNPYVRTPNLDRLAEKSVSFTNAYCASPLCGPTRHSLATGRYPYQHGVINNVLLPLDGMYTIAHHLRKHGYRTSCFGHMHWQRLDEADRKKYPTSDHGGEDVFMDHGYEQYAAIKLDTSRLDPATRYSLHLEQMCGRLTVASGSSYLTKQQFFGHAVAEASKQKLVQWHESGEPFLSWTSFHEPHPPFFPPYEYYTRFQQEKLPLPVQRTGDGAPLHPSLERRIGRNWALMNGYDHRRTKAAYYGLVDLVDEYIGEVLDTLDQCGLWQDTMIVFTVDHGEMLGDHGLYSKSTLREEAAHIPFMVYHPQVAPGTRSGFVEHVDVFPTICDFLGLDCPETVAGKSLRPLLESPGPVPGWRDFAFSHLGNDVMVRTRDWKLILYIKEPGELFDMVNDPHELCNVIDRHPEVVEGLVETMNEHHPTLFQANDRHFGSNRFRKPKRRPRVQLVESQ